MDFAKLSGSRYSLRKYSDRPVEAEKLALILESGRNAPTAHNNQPQRIFVLQSPEALEKADILGGLPIPEGILWCATEKVSKAELDRTAAIVKEVLSV